MALYVVLASKRVYDNKNNVLEKWIGTQLPKLENEDVIQVQADGHELVYILDKFKNIPLPPATNQVQSWFGDMAKFIYHNLRW